jgi:hypothetical protein
LQKEILESLKDAGNGPLGSRVLRIENVERRKELKDALSKARESQLVVAALIATVTFAAAFTLPGGYKNDQGPNKGTPILAKKTVFIVFVISDTISLMLSILAVFVHFLISLIKGCEMLKNKEMDGGTTEILFGVATLLTMIGMGTMIIAFITGIFAVLEPFLGLAISTCLIGMSFFILVSLVFMFICKNLKD